MKPKLNCNIWRIKNMSLSWVLSSKIKILIFLCGSFSWLHPEKKQTVSHVTSYHPLCKNHASIYKREYELISKYKTPKNDNIFLSYLNDALVTSTLACHIHFISLFKHKSVYVFSCLQLGLLQMLQKRV